MTRNDLEATLVSFEIETNNPDRDPTDPNSTTTNLESSLDSIMVSMCDFLHISA